MEVICKMHKTCYYRNTCDHAKIHDIISNSFANNCSFNIDAGVVYVHGQDIICNCSTTHLRKYKLDKIKNT